MARKKLTKAAIGFIIEKRNDWNVNYTFADIAKLLEEDFGIIITEQAVSKSYRKHKDDDELQTLLAVAKNKTSSKVRHKHTKTNVTPVIPTATEGDRDFDEDAGKKHDVSQFF